MAEETIPNLTPTNCLALAVVVLAGFADAVSFLQFDKLYVSFMSGNTTALGVAAAKADWAKAGLLGLLLGLFVVGVMLGAWLHRASRRPAPTVLAVVASLLALAAGWWAGRLPLLLLVLSMGILNSAINQTGRSPLTLTFVTGALVKVGTGLFNRLSGQPLPDDWGRQALDWLGLAVGAGVGALAWHWLGLKVLLGAASWALLLALLARRVPEA